jgi:SHS2 domain-containing protein
LLVDAARMVSDVTLDRCAVREAATVEVDLAASEPADLLLDWLRELLYVFSARGFAVARASVRMKGPSTLHAELHGEPYDPGRHGLKLEIKTPTYHGYRFEQTESGCRAVILFDV